MCAQDIAKVFQDDGYQKWSFVTIPCFKTTVGRPTRTTVDCVFGAMLFLFMSLDNPNTPLDKISQYLDYLYGHGPKDFVFNFLLRMVYLSQVGDFDIFGSALSELRK